MAQRISKIRHQYAGRWFNAGDPVDVEQQHVAVLCMAGHIEPEAGDPGYKARDIPSGSYLTRQLRRKKAH